MLQGLPAVNIVGFSLKIASSEFHSSFSMFARLVASSRMGEPARYFALSASDHSIGDVVLS